MFGHKRWPLWFFSLVFREKPWLHKSHCNLLHSLTGEMCLSFSLGAAESPWGFYSPHHQLQLPTFLLDQEASWLPADGSFVWVALRASGRCVFFLTEACHLSLLEVAMKMIPADSSCLPSGGSKQTAHCWVNKGDDDHYFPRYAP